MKKEKRFVIEESNDFTKTTQNQYNKSKTRPNAEGYKFRQGQAREISIKLR